MLGGIKHLISGSVGISIQVTYGIESFHIAFPPRNEVLLLYALVTCGVKGILSIWYICVLGLVCMFQVMTDRFFLGGGRWRRKKFSCSRNFNFHFYCN